VTACLCWRLWSSEVWSVTQSTEATGRGSAGYGDLITPLDKPGEKPSGGHYRRGPTEITQRVAGRLVRCGTFGCLGIPFTPHLATRAAIGLPGDALARARTQNLRGGLDVLEALVARFLKH
jgi:hypothetical protein